MAKAIDANTKISALLKAHPDALETVIGISPKFNKLRNPILRKMVAGRTTIAMACKIGGISVPDFLEKLIPLGLEIEKNTPEQNTEEHHQIPNFVKDISQYKTTELDVRPVINSGQDPFKLIMQAVKQIQQGEVFKLINSFEPVPLIPTLQKQGFEHYVEVVDENTVNTYFYKSGGGEIKEPVKAESSEDWQSKLHLYQEKLVTIDVRHLEMPMPMMTILEELEKLPLDKALYVYHKRIPVFLLPELRDRKFDYRINELSESEVHLLIFKA